MKNFRRDFLTCCKVPLEDLRSASELVVRALLVRKKYMVMSSQQFPRATERFLQQLSTHAATAELATTSDSPSLYFGLLSL